VTCATDSHAFAIARSSHAANLYAFDISSYTRLPTAVLPARDAVEVPDQDLDCFGSRRARSRAPLRSRDRSDANAPRFVTNRRFMVDVLAALVRCSIVNQRKFSSRIRSAAICDRFAP
jgi:hypothetical protein